MANRIIKESICASETLENLSWFEEVFFYRLIVNCDDYGRFDGRSAILKSRLFPLKNITDKTLLDALEKLTAAGLILPYEHESKQILQLVTWDKHQTVRNKRSKYPAIDGSDSLSASENVEEIRKISQMDNTCKQLKTIESNCVSRAQNPIQSNPNPIQSESESESIMHGAVETASEQQQAEKSIFHLPLNDGTEHHITQTDVNRWADLYPAVDIMQDLRNMKGWLEAKPSRKKTKRGINAFINNWLSTTQNKGGTKGYGGVGNTDGQNGGQATERKYYGTVLI